MNASQAVTRRSEKVTFTRGGMLINYGSVAFMALFLAWIIKLSQKPKPPRTRLSVVAEARDAGEDDDGDYIDPCTLYRDRPYYYLLNEQGEPVPIGRSYLVTAEEYDQWQAFLHDPATLTLAETVVWNPDQPELRVVISTVFTAMDVSLSLGDEVKNPVLWATHLDTLDLDTEVDLDDDDFGLLVEARLEALAAKLNIPRDEYFSREQYYSTRNDALQGHDGVVRWVRKALGAF